MDDLPTERTDDDKWKAAKRAMMIMTWMAALFMLMVMFFVKVLF